MLRSRLQPEFPGFHTNLKVQTQEASPACEKKKARKLQDFTVPKIRERPESS